MCNGRFYAAVKQPISCKSVGGQFLIYIIFSSTHIPKFEEWVFSRAWGDGQSGGRKLLQKSNMRDSWNRSVSGLGQWKHRLQKHTGGFVKSRKRLILMTVYEQLILDCDIAP